MTSKPRNPFAPQYFAIIIFVGIALTMLGNSLDGFVRGLCQGAGVALILTSVVVLSARWSKPGEKDGMWLPSREEDEQ